jgi:thiamine-monophosphate kinase
VVDATGGSEFAAIERIAARFPAPPGGELWIGDDAAVVRIGGADVVVAADALVSGVHFDLSVTTIADAGWKALAVNISDLAAMGCVATRALVTVSGPPETDIDGLYEGIAEASERFACPVVGGDLTNAPVLVVSVTVLGDGGVTPRPVRRAGAQPGDVVWVTGPLGAASAALHARRSHLSNARPVPRVAEGVAARELGATAMIDVSDGFGADLGHVLDASGVGFELEGLPVAEGATPEEALSGGDDYELVWCGPAGTADGFAVRGLRPPVRVGTIVADPGRRPLPSRGWSHRFGA